MNTYSNVAASSSFSSEDLITQHVELVKRIAQHLIARLPSSVDIDDLMQSGMVGLLEAANNFDPTRGASFETYAGIRIRGSMLDDIRKHDWTPRSVHHKYRQVAEAINAIESELGDIMLVGHLPFLERLAGLLIAGNAESSIVTLEAGALLELTLMDERWTATCLMQPRLLLGT